MINRIEELESLLFDWEAGDLPAEGVARVREILRTDAEARAYYARHQALNAAMQLESDAGLTPVLEADSPVHLHGDAAGDTTATRRAPFPWGWMSLAGVALLACVGCVWFLLPPASPAPSVAGPAARPSTSDGRRNESKEATSHGVAILTRLVDVRWKAGQPGLQPGDALEPGIFAIEAGHAQIEFFSGATVIVEGPAELQLQSASLARVRSGRLRAQVPPAARGFSLEVDDMKVVDLGTEFALSVSDEGASVQVFDGEVELHQPAAAKRLLTAGQALTRTAQGGYKKSEVTPQKFVGIEALASRARGQNAARYQRWKAWSTALRRDPRLILYYAFDEQEAGQRRLPCSMTPRNRDLDGAIVGARHVAGRWGARTALEFKQPADRVRVHAPGEFGSLTFSCWAKIDSLDRWYNSLFLTDHYNQGEPHWQILDTGQLFFSVRWKPDHNGSGLHKHGATHRVVLSPPFWKPSMSGKWLHLATTYNAVTGRATHYLNGRQIHTAIIPEHLRVTTTRIGAASLGNWSSPTRPDAGFAIRNLNGSIDEFAVFSAALTPAEIKDIYDNGAP